MPDYVSNIYRKMINISASFTFVCRLSNRSNVSITGFISGGMTSNQCFVAGTAILTSSGYVAIENIRAGDMVWASDPETGETELKPVVQTFRNETTELVHVTVNGEEIICTKEHPFYSPVKGWTAACRLRAGDILVLVNGEYVVVEQVQHELLESPVATYNFEVQDFHTYYVGKESVLVHNLCRKDFATKATQNKSATFGSEREARNFARTKIGHNPVQVESGKLRSSNGIWQYRAKVNDLAQRHIHLEKLNAKTGEVLINWHLRW